MTIDQHRDTSDDQLLGNESQRPRVKAIFLANGFHPVVIRSGTGDTTWDNHLLSLLEDSVAWQAPTPTDKHLTSIGRVLKCDQVSSLQRLPADASVGQKSLVAAHSQPIAPSVHQHSVALTEERHEPFTLNSIDSECQCSEAEHDHKCYDYRQEKLQPRHSAT